MKRVILVYIFVSGIACNNSNTTKNSDGNQINKTDKIRSAEESEKSDTNRNTYNWSQQEQNKFMTDCRKEFEESVGEGKIKELCSCILIQARQHYQSYSQMEKKGDDDHDREIIIKCLGDYDDGDE